MPRAPAVPSYAQTQAILRERLGAIGFKGRAGQFARRTTDTWEVFNLFCPPQWQGERGAVRFKVSVAATLHVVRRYSATWTRSNEDMDKPPLDSMNGFLCDLEPTDDSHRGWRADASTDPIELAGRIWDRFQSVGLSHLSRYPSAIAVRDLLLAELSRPEPGVHGVIWLAILAKQLGPKNAYDRAMKLLEDFPTPVPSWKQSARDHWYMIPRYA